MLPPPRARRAALAADRRLTKTSKRGRPAPRPRRLHDPSKTARPAPPAPCRRAQVRTWPAAHPVPSGPAQIRPGCRVEILACAAAAAEGGRGPAAPFVRIALPGSSRAPLPHAASASPPSGPRRTASSTPQAPRRPRPFFRATAPCRYRAICEWSHAHGRTAGVCAPVSPAVAALPVRRSNIAPCRTVRRASIPCAAARLWASITRMVKYKLCNGRHGRGIRRRRGC